MAGSQQAPQQAAVKKVGPNDKCSCGSGAKAKKCCYGGAAYSPVKTAKGESVVTAKGGDVLPGDADELWKLGREALAAGEDKKASHHLTMALGVITKGMSIDKHGVASEADLLAYNKSSEGKLAKVLADRSQVHLRQGDTAAALEDADTCTRADPTYEQGHLRLAVAYEAASAPLRVQLEACERGVASCPDSEVLVTRKWRLKKAIAQQPHREEPETEHAASDDGPNESAIAKTRRLADDSSHPRRAMAAADFGSVLAVGAHGVEKDLEEAERYLRIGVEGGDISAQRNLGLVLLELDRSVEAAEQLSSAVKAGDEQAAGILQQLNNEAEERQKEGLAKLQAMAAAGDPRAKAMLQELSSQ